MVFDDPLKVFCCEEAKQKNADNIYINENVIYCSETVFPCCYVFKLDALMDVLSRLFGIRSASAPL